MMMEGTLTVDSPSLRNALRWTGQAPPGSGGFGRFALKARANVVGPSIALTNVNVELDGNVAEGVMTYANNGRQTLQATLAADALDFTPYVSTFRLLASGARDWNRQLFDLNSLSTTDLDMRLSAARVTVGSTRLGRTAFGANLRGGALALSVGEAQMYGGIAKGSFGIARSDDAADVKAQFQFTDVDLQSCASELFGVNKLSGRGNLNVSLTASGSSPFGLAQSLDGTATLIGHDGAISGFNAEQLLRRLERRPLSGGGNFRHGSTPYDNLTVSVKFADGIATAEDVHVEGPSARLTLTGTASVPAREYDLKGTASLVSATERAARLRTALCGAGPMGRSLDLSRSGQPDPALAGFRAAARCGEGSQDARRRALGAGALYGRRAEGAGAGRRSTRGRAGGGRCGKAELSVRFVTRSSPPEGLWRGSASSPIRQRQSRWVSFANPLYEFCMTRNWDRRRISRCGDRVRPC